MGFKSHIFLKKIGSRRVSPGLTHQVDRVVASAGLLTNPDWSSPGVDPPDRSGFNNYGRNGQRSTLANCKI